MLAIIRTSITSRFSNRAVEVALLCSNEQLGTSVAAPVENARINTFCVKLHNVAARFQRHVIDPLKATLFCAYFMYLALNESLFP